MTLSILLFRLVFVGTGVLCNLVLLIVFANLSMAVFYGYLGLYLGFAVLMVTPLADRWIDLSLGTRVPTRKELSQLNGIEEELTEAARERGKAFPRKLRLRVITDNYQNAMAFGHRSIGLTSGLLKTGTDAQVRAIFAHEVGHLVHRDTTFHALVTAAFGPILWLGIFCASFVWGMMRENLVGVLFGVFFLILFLIPILALLLYSLFNFIASFLSRPIEYAADAYAMELTRDDGLISWLQLMEVMDVGPSGRFLAAYQASHPPMALREDRARLLLENMTD